LIWHELKKSGISLASCFHEANEAMAVAECINFGRYERSSLPLHNFTTLTISEGLERENIFMTINLSQHRLFIGLAAAFFFTIFGPVLAQAQQFDAASVIHQIDEAVKARIDNLAGYSVTEHYAVYRGKDEIHPIAEMTVMTTYRKESGKSYTIVSQSGSEIIQKLVLSTILSNEQHLNEPGVREGAWITSENYEMKLKPGGIQMLDGRSCLVLSLIPRRKASFLIEGTLWVDPKDGSIVQVQGTTSKSASFLTGPTQVMRHYASFGGYPEATQVRAVSNSFMFGETILEIDYTNYHIQLLPPV
jgi:outer membrane lipoprotein-sorting protein